MKRPVSLRTSRRSGWMSGYGGDRDASRRQVRASPSGKTTNAVEILRHRFIAGKPDMEAMVEEERIHAEVARRVHELRTKAGLSQRELARRVGTTASVICRWEEADYQGHSLSMLRRIATALNCRVSICFVEKPVVPLSVLIPPVVCRDWNVPILDDLASRSRLETSLRLSRGALPRVWSMPSGLCCGTRR